MTEPRTHIAQLDDAHLAQVREVEDILGVYLVALAPPAPLAQLSEEQLKKVQELEQALGVVLLAYGRSR